MTRGDRERARWVRRAVASGVLALAAPCFPAVSRAESPKPSEAQQNTERAAARYDEGVRAFRAARYKDAIDRFSEADSIAPSPALSFNMALAYERLLDSAGALGHYREYLRREPTAPRAEDVQQKIRALEAELATRGVQQLTLRSEPLGATVVIDGKPVGVTPWMGVVQPGPHAVELRFPGYHDFSQRVILSKDHAITFDFRLNRALERKVPLGQGEGRAENQRRADVPLSKSNAVWPWVAFGGSAASLLVAGAFELGRERAERRAQSQTTQIGYDDAANEADSRRDKARVFAGIGGGLAITGVVLLFALPEPRRAANTAIGCSGDGCFGSWETQF